MLPARLESPQDVDGRLGDGWRIDLVGNDGFLHQFEEGCLTLRDRPNRVFVRTLPVELLIDKSFELHARGNAKRIAAMGCECVPEALGDVLRRSQQVRIGQEMARQGRRCRDSAFVVHLPKGKSSLYRNPIADLQGLCDLDRISDDVDTEGHLQNMPPHWKEYAEARLFDEPGPMGVEVQNDFHGGTLICVQEYRRDGFCIEVGDSVPIAVGVVENRIV